MKEDGITIENGRRVLTLNGVSVWLPPEEPTYEMKPLFEALATEPPREKVDYRTYLQSPEWQRIRRIKLSQAGGRCANCHGEYTDLHVHHLTYERLGYERPEDLTVLCARCHRERHGIT